jgi:phosphoribosylformimino-5-aminoimidazole carboxamide ribotide isomerase
VAGRRHEYRSIVSRLTDSAQPLSVARAFREHFGLGELYLADLDAILGGPPALPIYEMLRRDGFRLWVDAGIRTAADGQALADAGVETIVAGLETLAGPEVLVHLCRRWDSQRIVFSLDLKEGKPSGKTHAWPSDPWEVAAKAITCGVQRLLVLDLARVGVGQGTGTEDLCARLARAHPGLELTAGGGIRSMADIQRLAAHGVQAVLIASALHDGGIRREDIEAARAPVR